MTLPTTVTLPLSITVEQIANPSLLADYLRKLVYVLSTQIQQTNFSVNGTTIKFTDDPLVPYDFILGSTTPGTATYTNTVLQSRRINLMTYAWFDISWTLHTGTGNVLIQLPYFSQNTDNLPYVAVIESDGNAFTAGYTYLTGNLTPNTNTIGINQNGSGLPILALPLAASGHLRGSIVYAGQQFR